jgi:hypothetical protein
MESPQSPPCATSVVSEAFHQDGPRAGDVLRVPSGAGGLPEKAMTRQRRNHDVSARATAIGCGVGQWINDL